MKRKEGHHHRKWNPNLKFFFNVDWSEFKWVTLKSLAISFIFYSKTHEKTGKLKIYSNFQISLNNRNNKNEPDFLWPERPQIGEISVD